VGLVRIYERKYGPVRWEVFRLSLAPTLSLRTIRGVLFGLFVWDFLYPEGTSDKGLTAEKGVYPPNSSGIRPGDRIDARLCQERQA